MAHRSWSSAGWLQLVYLALSLSVAAAVRDASQVPLLQAESDGLTQFFTLRHVFYHDIDPAREVAVFAEIVSSQSFEDSGQSRTEPLSLPIKVHKSTAQPPSAELEADTPASHEYLPITTPNITDRETIINLATMTSDVYYASPADPNWRNISQGFNDSLPFGYDVKGLRGHVFANQDNSTVIIAFKGTTIDVLDRTPSKDRFNDNLLFSCCCATQRPPPFWYGQVCDCRDKTYTCNSTCLTTELLQPDRYYSVASSIVHNVTNDLYPASNIWMTGHSLGGSLASLMGLTFDLPAVSFEAPPDRLAAERLGIAPVRNDTSTRKPRYHAYHFGNTADPVYVGACNGVTSWCAAAGFSFESYCFTGKRCVYDTVGEKGWHVNVLNHRINTVIDTVLTVYEDVPECKDEEPECVDCAMWNFHP